MNKIFVNFLVLMALTLPKTFADTAIAEMGGTTSGSPIKGRAIFEETADGLKVTADFENVPDGKHGFHIHEGSACTNEGKDAGGHFNPDGVKHGDVLKDGFAGAHAGDFGNIEIKDGKGAITKTLPHLTVKDGKYSVLNHAVIFHEKEDDFGQPTGNAGGRIACGVIKQESEQSITVPPDQG